MKISLTLVRKEKHIWKKVEMLAGFKESLKSENSKKSRIAVSCLVVHSICISVLLGG